MYSNVEGAEGYRPSLREKGLVKQYDVCGVWGSKKNIFFFHYEERKEKKKPSFQTFYFCCIDNCHVKLNNDWCAQ